MTDNIQFYAGGRALGDIAMTITTAGVINVPQMPTSTAGLNSGDLWNNLGTINIIP